MNPLEQSAKFFTTEAEGFFDQVLFLMPNWKWISLLVAIVAFMFARGFIRGGLTQVKKNLNFLKDKTFPKYFFDQDIEKGLSWVIVALLGMVVVDSLALPSGLDQYLHLFCKLLLAINFVRVVYLAADAAGHIIENWAATTDSPVDDQLAPLATKSLKVVVVIVGVLVVLENLKFEVTAVLAGLGIGGVALAFAAQDTVANVFGTITILLDTPFKLGDRVKIGDTEGTIEEVGFRSTQIRTLYNSIVTLPNSVVAKEKIDNLTERNNVFRFRTVLGFTYNSTADQLSKFCDQFHYYLKQDAKVDQERITVNFCDLAESSMNVLVNFHYKLDDVSQETFVNQTYFFEICKIAAQLKLDFAFPTRTVIWEAKSSDKVEKTASL